MLSTGEKKQGFWLDSILMPNLGRFIKEFHDINTKTTNAKACCNIFSRMGT